MLENEILAAAKQKQQKSAKQLNLTNEQSRGLKKLQERVKNGEIVIFETDKSGRLGVDKKENYDEAMKVHMMGMEMLKEEDCGKRVQEVERECNGLSRIWVKMFSMGEGVGHEKRIMGNVMCSYSQPAPLYGLRKDHKMVQEGQEPPTRPVCGAVTGPNAVISSLLAEMISYINIHHNVMSCHNVYW